MANFPSLSELKETFLFTYESKINQDSPLNNKAFLRLTATVLAIIAMLLQREVLQETKENLALTASREGLIRIGNNYDLPIKNETSAVLKTELPATTGTVIPALTNFTGDDNGVLYYNASPVTASADIATLEVTSRTPGVIGNLQVGQTLSISRQIPGAGLTAVITEILVTGAEAEDTEAYRQRVLDIIRSPGGGGNAADHRNWGQEEEGVKRIYPYSGRPFGDPLDPSPPNRTDYVEADESIDPDGIAPQSLLDSTKQTIRYDPVTGLKRESQGLTADTLHLASIRRSSIFVEIRNAVFAPGTEAKVKADIETELAKHFLSLNPYIDGLDIESERNDLITDLTVTEVVQDVLKANSASAEAVAFGLAPGEFLPKYYLQEGEKAKLGGVNYA